MRTAIITIVIIAVFLEVSGVIWSGKDGEPGDAYRRLSQPPDKLINDPRSNGYFMMIGFAASADSDPVRTGLDIWQEAETDGNRRHFNYRKSGRTQLRTTLDADEAFPAWLSTSPLAEFRKHDAFLRLSMNRYSILLDRYERFVEMPFDDLGFGHRDIPRLDEFLIVHRLYVASGYAQSPQLGWVRVQRDLRAWRRVLAEARTLAVKTAALVILEDTLAFLANVPAGDRMSSMTSLLAVTQPFTKDDYSLRWPIRNEFVLGTSQGRATDFQEVSMNRRA